MHNRTSIAITIALATSSVAYCADIHVNPGQSIQAAINAANNGDRILVHPGTYFEAIDLLTKSLEVQGIGGAGVTTIDATGIANSVVAITGAQTNTTVVKGLTLTGGTGRVLSGTPFGGGIYRSGGSISVPQPTVTDCVILSNHVGPTGLGGGVYAQTGANGIRLVNTTVQGNAAFRGGGTYGYVSMTTCLVIGNIAIENGGGAFQSGPLEDTTFDSNQAQNGGGAYNPSIWTIKSSSLGVKGPVARFVGNIATNAGGGAYFDIVIAALFPEDPFPDAVLFRCHFSGNAAPLGGGLYVTASAFTLPFFSPTFTVANCVFAQNAATQGDGAVLTVTGTKPIGLGYRWCSFDANGAGGDPAFFVDCILRNSPNPFVAMTGAPTGVQFSNIQGGFAGIGNYDANPQWVNPAGDDYQLAASSPCVDAHVSTGIEINIPYAFDRWGSPRRQGVAFDTGADEFDQDCDANGVADFAQIAAGAGTDCDGDFVLDACEPLPDCNLNGLNDVCEIKSGAVIDCNHNMVPDSCEFLPDCDGDGIADTCEIALGAPDCNANGIPDSCDIANGTSADIDHNGVPDSCHGIRAVPSQYPTIQHAIVAAVNGDTVLVADGTYSGVGFTNLDFMGKQILVASANGPAHCVLDGGGLNQIAVFDASNEGLLTRLRGFTFTGGTAVNGGAILVTNGANPFIDHCIFRGNLATSGGAIAVVGTGNPYVTCCTFIDNVALQFGGALHASNPSNSNAKMFLEHCTIVGNAASTGGGIGISPRGNAILWDCVVWANTAPQGPSFSLSGAPNGASMLVHTSDVEGGAAAAYVTNNNSLQFFADNIVADPRFVDLAARDLHLCFTSPCRNIGIRFTKLDLDGDSVGLQPDIGADEFATRIYTVGEASPGQTITLCVIGTPGSTPVLELFGTSLLTPSVFTPFGGLLAGPPYVGDAPIVLPAIPADGVFAYPVPVPAATPIGVTVYRQTLLGPPTNALTNLDPIIIVP